jgi:hypothetical protein
MSVSDQGSSRAARLLPGISPAWERVALGERPWERISEIGTAMAAVTAKRDDGDGSYFFGVCATVAQYRWIKSTFHVCWSQTYDQGFYVLSELGSLSVSALGLHCDVFQTQLAVESQSE